MFKNVFIISVSIFLTVPSFAQNDCRQGVFTGKALVTDSEAFFYQQDSNKKVTTYATLALKESRNSCPQSQSWGSVEDTTAFSKLSGYGNGTDIVVTGFWGYPDNSNRATIFASKIEVK